MNPGLSGRVAWLLYPLTAVVMLFVLAPLAVVVAMSVSASQFATFPPRGFTLGWYGRVLVDPDFRASLGFSAALAAGATAGALALGLPAAFALARHAVPGRDTLRLILLSPLIFPALAIGVALLRLFSDWNSNSAPLNLLIGHILALLLQQLLFGNVLMGGNPTTFGSRCVDGVNDPAVARGDDVFGDLPGRDAVHDVLAVLRGIAGEQSGLLTVLDQLPQRAARLHHLGR